MQTNGHKEASAEAHVAMDQVLGAASMLFKKVTNTMQHRMTMILAKALVSLVKPSATVLASNGIVEASILATSVGVAILGTSPEMMRVMSRAVNEIVYPLKPPFG